jgi:hypothetical protein
MRNPCQIKELVCYSLAMMILSLLARTVCFLLSRQHALHDMDLERFHFVSLDNDLPLSSYQDVEMEQVREYSLHCLCHRKDSPLEEWNDNGMQFPSG